MDKQALEQAIRTAYKKRKTTEVKNLSTEAVTSYPEDAFGYAYLAKAALLERPVAYDDAELNWTKVSELAPDNTIYLNQFAKVKMKIGKYSDAQLIWAKIVELEPDHLEALSHRGRHLLENETEYKQAIDIFDQAIHFHPKYTQGYLYRATAYFALEENEKAWSDYQAFAELNKKEENVGELHLKTNILTKLDDKEGLIGAYKQLTELIPDNGSFPMMVAEFSELLEHYEDAAEYYGRAIPLLDKTAGQYSSATFSWGNVLHKTKQYEKAIEAYEMNAQCSDQPFYSYSKQIDVYLDAKQEEKALERIDMAQKVNTDVFDDRKLSKLKADILYKLRRYQEAAKVLYSLVEVESLFRNEAALLLGKILYMAKEMPTAYHYLRLASLSREQKATNYLNRNFKDYIFSLQKDFYAKHDKTAKANAKSAFLKKINGKIWRFERLRKIESDIDAEVELLEELSVEMTETVLLYLTEVGFLLVIPESVDFYAYSIKEANAKEIVMETQSIDGYLKGDTTLKLTDEGLLDYCITGNEDKAMLLKEVTVEEINEPIKIRLQQAIESRNIDFLGGNNEAVNKAIWS